MHTALNRPTVLALAGIDSECRIIPAAHVRELQDAATGVACAGQRVQEAEARCLKNIDKTSHAAWQRGYSQGHAEALKSLRGFHDALNERRKSLDLELLGLVMDAVRKIVHTLPPDLLLHNLIASALNEAQEERGRLVLRVHPSHAAAAEQWLGERAGQEGASLRILVEPDASQAADDCTLETPSGAIDTGLRTQLEAIAAALHESVAA